jgi:hypothetical protein
VRDGDVELCAGSDGVLKVSHPQRAAYGTFQSWNRAGLCYEAALKRVCIELGDAHSCTLAFDGSLHRLVEHLYRLHSACELERGQLNELVRRDLAMEHGAGEHASLAFQSKAVVGCEKQFPAWVFWLARGSFN